MGKIPLIQMIESSSYESVYERIDLTPYLDEEDFDDYMEILVGRFAFVGFCIIGFFNFILYGHI